MSQIIQSKRRQGGQPGNQNAKNNCGNKHARGTFGNRGGSGAPLYNSNAYKSLTLETDLLSNFSNDPEVLDWVRRNAAKLREIELPKENDIISSRYSCSTDHLANTGQEYRQGVFCLQEEV